MEDFDRLMTSQVLQTDEEESIRPQSLEEYIGQDSLKENLKIYWSAETMNTIVKSFTEKK